MGKYCLGSTTTTMTVLIVLLTVPLMLPDAAAEAYIPQDEYLGYFDSGGMYTVVGNVKNMHDFSIIPTVTVSVMDDSNVFSNTFTHVPIASHMEIPFKTKFPQVRGDPVLLDADLTFTKTYHLSPSMEVLYDDTLIIHNDGHLTGRIQNTGDRIIYFPTVYAVVHGYDSVLDIVQNMELIEKIEPGQIMDFSMYPDPAITDDVFYYSCFAPVDTTVIPVTVNKNGNQFDFRYDSGAWFHTAEFDDGETLTMRVYNSYPLETYANFEFAPISGNEEFSVTLDGMPVGSFQSIDEMGYWHVAFSVEPTYQGIMSISGFEKGLPAQLPLIPQWIKTNAGWWSTNQITDSEFLQGISFLLDKQIIAPQREVVAVASWDIPSWVKILSDLWFQDKISDEDFVDAMTFLITKGIIRI